jgi:hypothetical protein
MIKNLTPFLINQKRKKINKNILEFAGVFFNEYYREIF